jgi:hypothetical protein
LHGGVDVESRVTTRPLRTVARTYCGTTGFQASAMARELTDAAATGGELFRFVVSGNIDRYCIRWGRARFMKRCFDRPVLPSASMLLTDAKRRLFQGPKIVIAGMTRRIEAAWDPGGMALGVQVYCAAELREDRRYLLGLLNSKLFSFLFRGRFRAKQLAGGFLSVNKSQLDQLPVRIVERGGWADQRIRQRLVRHVERLEQLTAQAAGTTPRATEVSTRIRALDQEIDRCVYQLYRLTAAEIARVEAEFPLPP